MAPPENTPKKILQGSIRLNSGAIGFSCGVLCGGILFVATLWLVLKGGDHIGSHLALLSHFFPGYSVSILGSFAGLLYGFAVGTIGGSAVGWIYNRIVAAQRYFAQRMSP